MTAPRTPGRISRCFAALWGSLLPRRRSLGTIDHAPADSGAETALRDTVVVPPAVGANAQQVLATPEEFADAADQPAVPPRLRTLEEVRADLALLRERTRTLQAQAQARRERSFAPTDFMDFADAKPAADQGPASGFAPTDFLDFGMPSPQPGR